MKSSFLFLVAVCLCAFSVQPLRSAEGAAAPGIEGIEWSLQKIHGQPAHAGERGRQTLKLEAAKKQALGYAGVNRFFGGYQLNGDKLKLGPLAGTMMAGPEKDMNAETAYHAALADVTNWRVTEGALELLKDKTVVLRFTAAKAENK